MFGAMPRMERLPVTKYSTFFLHTGKRSPRLWREFLAIFSGFRKTSPLKVGCVTDWAYYYYWKLLADSHLKWKNGMMSADATRLAN